MMSGPLRGKVVIDLTAALAGPYATLLLAGLGARVIKVEPPGGGDLARNNSPYLTVDGVSTHRTCDEDMSTSILTRGRGKESVVIDLKSSEGRAILLDLVRTADLVVENFSAGVTRRLGIDYDSLRATNPKLVYVSITGFGSDANPRRKAMDTIIQGMSGLMMTIGEEDDPPVRVGIPIADLVAPLYALIGALAAMRDADLTGEGQHVDISMLGALTSLVAAEGLDALDAVGMPTRTGPYMARLAPFGTFEAADGWFTVCAPTDQQAAATLATIGRGDLIESEEFGTRDARVVNASRLHALVAGWAADRRVEEVLAAFASRGVPAEPVRTPRDAVRDPALHARREVVPLTHPSRGEIPDMFAPGVPIVLSKTPAEQLSPAPAVGAQSDDVLAGLLGYSRTQIAGLRERGVIG